MNVRKNVKTDKHESQGTKERAGKNGQQPRHGNDTRSGSRDNRRDDTRSGSRDNRRSDARSGSRDNRRSDAHSGSRDNRRDDARSGSRDNRRSDQGEQRVTRTFERTARFTDEQEDRLRLEGRNSVLEALNSGRTIDKVLVKKGEVEGTLKVIVAKARDAGVVVQEVSKQKLDEMAQSGNHQGVIAMCPAHEYAEVSDILDKAKARGEQPFIIILDGITDTHNLGAVIRSADAAGAHGVIIPKHRAAGLTGIVSKTSAGALQYVHVAKVVNISRTIDELKEKGIWVAAADMKGESLYTAPLDGPIAIVIGGEGSGAGRLVREKCDFVVKIPMRGKIPSLNASVAAGILMYEVVRRRHYLRTE